MGIVAKEEQAVNLRLKERARVRGFGGLEFP
jgi:hypothetical protein